MGDQDEPMPSEEPDQPMPQATPEPKKQETPDKSAEKKAALKKIIGE